LIFVLRENKDPGYLQRYVEEKKKVSENYEKGLYEGNEEFIRKYIAFARTLKPVLTNDAYSFLKEFYINMGYSGISGLPRKFDSLIRITVAIAKLKLKNTADVDEAEEAIIFYNKRLEYFNSAAGLATHPRDKAFLKIKEIIKEKNGLPILLTDAAIEASKKEQGIEFYLLGQGKFKNKKIEDLKLNNSYQLKQILIFLRNDACIQIIQEKPTTLRWKKENEKNHEVENESSNDQQNNTDQQIIDSVYETSKNHKTQKINNEIQYPIVRECDACDLCDTPEDYNTQSKEIITTNTDNTILKDTKTDNNNSINDNIKNEVNTARIDNTYKDNQIKQTTEVIIGKENQKNKGIDKESSNMTEQPSSHSSHSSHSTCESPSNEQNGEIIKIDAKNLQEDDSDQQLEPQLQLKHSSNADIFTNESIQNMQDSKKQQSTEDNSFTSNSNTEEAY
jgi:hypothetical protein